MSRIAEFLTKHEHNSASLEISFNKESNRFIGTLGPLNLQGDQIIVHATNPANVIFFIEEDLHTKYNHIFV